MAKPGSAAGGAEVSRSQRKVSHQGTGRVVECDVGHVVSAQDFPTGDVVDDVLIQPECIRPRDILKNAASGGIIQSAGGVVDSQVRIGEAGGGNGTGIETKTVRGPIGLSVGLTRMRHLPKACKR